MEENNYVVFKKQYGNIKRPRVKELSKGTIHQFKWRENI